MSQHVAILSYDGQALFELGCAVELFCLARPDIPGWYSGQVVSFDDKAHPGTGGVSIQAKHIKSLRGFDMLVIPSWHVNGEPVPDDLAKAIRRFYNRGGRVLSFCSGAFLLAELGILDDRRAITHWRYAEAFRERFHHISFSDNVLYEFDGRVGCSAGSAAALDLGLKVIGYDFGHAVANKVARRLVVSSHRAGGQLQFVETPVPKHRHALSEIMDWAGANLHKVIDIDGLANRAAMSRRNFDRRFRSLQGESPKAWLITQRLNLAQSILETQSTGIENVAQQAGFESAASLRHHFRRCFAISPTQYRENFKMKDSLAKGYKNEKTDVKC